MPKPTKLKIVVLNSHGDSCSFNTILNSVLGNTVDAKITAIICSNKESMEYAKNKIGLSDSLSIPVFLVDRKSFGEDIDNFNNNIHEILNTVNFDLIVMAGFLSLFKVGEKYKNRVINLHPALFRTGVKGRNAYGKKVYEQILRENLPAGATVHFADDEYDHGKIIVEREVPLLPDDTPETLGKRVCEEGTKIILPEAIRMIADGRIKIG